jgi:hypothetical protein
MRYSGLDERSNHSRGKSLKKAKVYIERLKVIRIIGQTDKSDNDTMTITYRLTHNET